MSDDELTEKIIACAFKVHKALGQGFPRGSMRTRCEWN